MGSIGIGDEPVWAQASMSAPEVIIGIAYF